MSSPAAGLRLNSEDMVRMIESACCTKTERRRILFLYQAAYWIAVAATACCHWPVACSAQGASSSSRAGDDVKEIYVSFDKDRDVFSFREVPDNFTVAHARFDNAVNRTGFGFLSITTVNDYTYQLNSSVQAYAAGLAEGFLTRESISLHYLNTVGDFCNNRTTSSCQELEEFLQQNLAWIIDNVNQNPDDSYWYQVRLFYEQIRGLHDGYHGTPSQISMKVEDVYGIYLLQIQNDVEDISQALFGSASSDAAGSQSDHCSALVKLLPSNKEITEILIAHDTWASYKTMLRILKRYDTYLHKCSTDSAPVLGHTMAFSSYPGTLVSTDDFYILSSAMITMETTNPIFDKNLYKNIQPKCVLESVRSALANRLAEDGADWSQLFSKYNSGTYNNQWMVVDLKKYDPYFHAVLPGFLTVLEQIPGYIHSADVTNTLLNAGYWGSYNLPYFPDIYNMSGLQEMESKYGDFFSHEKSPRAQIFKRDQSKVVDIETMNRLMRYNDFKNDPLSRCNCSPPYSGENAISSRSDLNRPDGQYPFSELDFGLRGGIDMKLTSFSMAFENLTFLAVSGPTFDALPPFQWSKAYNSSSVPHFGHPDLFQFEPVYFTGTL